MSVIDTLVFDRTEEDVRALLELYKTPYVDMTEAQKAEWKYGRATDMLMWKEGIPIECLDGILYCINRDGTNKGAYNYEDMNRVTEAMRYIDNIFKGYGYESGYVDMPTWTIDQEPSEKDIDTYLLNVGKLRYTFNVLEGTPELPDTLKWITFEKANAIERTLYNIEIVLEQIPKSFLYCGQVGLYCNSRPIQV